MKIEPTDGGGFYVYSEDGSVTHFGTEDEAKKLMKAGGHKEPELGDVETPGHVHKEKPAAPEKHSPYKHAKDSPHKPKKENKSKHRPVPRQ